MLLHKRINFVFRLLFCQAIFLLHNTRQGFGISFCPLYFIVGELTKL
ncbi:MAG: hypothetical protein ACJAYF_001420 [Arenicella sp.]|jgi:hypothetical protein